MAAPTSKQHVYDESKIKTLSSLEHIRARTGMYIGRIGDGSHYDDGVYVLLKEVIDNAIDEFIMGHGQEVLVTIDGTEVRVRDHGRGIPLGKIVECVSRINTGAKYNDDVFQFSVGLNGVGTKAVNALSNARSPWPVFAMANSRAPSFRQGRICSSTRRGWTKTGEEGRHAGRVLARPGDFQARRVQARSMSRVGLRLYTYLNAGLKIRYNGTLYHSKHGLLDLIDEDTDNQQDALYAAAAITARKRLNSRSRTPSASTKRITRSSTASTRVTAART